MGLGHQHPLDKSALAKNHIRKVLFLRIPFPIWEEARGGQGSQVYFAGWQPCFCSYSSLAPWATPSDEGKRPADAAPALWNCHKPCLGAGLRRNRSVARKSYCCTLSANLSCVRLALLVLREDKTETFLRNVCALTCVYRDLHQMVFPCLVMEFLPDHLACI